MGKHIKEEPNKDKHSLKKLLTIVIIIFAIALIACLIMTIIFQKGTRPEEKNNYISIKNNKTIEGEKLVFKSTSKYNKIMEYTFKENKLNTVKIYEQFANIEDFEKEKKKYQDNENIIILKADEKEKSIEIEKKDFGSDKDLSYEELCDKYLVQIIGAYDKI